MFQGVDCGVKINYTVSNESGVDEMGICYRTETKVYLDGKHIGTIRQKGSMAYSHGYQYTPKGAAVGGRFYPSLEACKGSLKD